MSRLTKLISEVHRRSLWQVLGIYAVASWVIYQVVQGLTEGLGLPDWFPALAVVLLLVGLPIVLATAFVQEGAPLVTRRDPTLLPATEAIATEPQAVSGTQRLFTWRNAILGGVLAFALLGIGTSAFMAMRVLGIGPVGTLIAKGVLEEEEQIVLADFESSGEDSLLAIAVQELIRIDLSQSPNVGLFGQEGIAATLERMGQERTATVTGPLAREIAIREGIKACLIGKLNRVGSGVAVSLELVDASTGTALFSDYKTVSDAADPEELFGAVGRLSRSFRERLGESLRSIQASEPLDRVTTNSLEALQKYAQAAVPLYVERDFTRARALIEEALALDSTFAAAHRRLAVLYYNSGGGRQAFVEAMEAALRHSEKASAAERYRAVSMYHHQVTFDNERAIAAYENALELDPYDRSVLNNLGLLYRRVRNWERSEELLRHVSALGSSTATSNLLTTLGAQGKFDEISILIDTLAAQTSADNPVAHYRRVELAATLEDYETAALWVERARELRPEDLNLQFGVQGRLASLARVRGRISEAEAHHRERIAIRLRQRRPAAYLGETISLAWMTSQHRSDPSTAIRLVDDALERFPLDSMRPLNRPYWGLAGFYAWNGQSDRARGYVAEYENAVEAGLAEDAWGDGMHIPKANIAITAGNPEEAIRLIREFESRRSNPMGWLPFLGLAYDSAGVADSTIAIYERYLKTPWLFRLGIDSWQKPRVMERLGQLYEQRGEREKAMYYYGKFVDLWKDADPDLQPRVEAARRAFAALSPDQ